jgi:hypothetical protein
MPKRRNEVESMIRQEPFEYRAAFDSSDYIEYEGWAVPGSATSASAWLICKHTHDSSGNLTSTQWADTASFDQIWDNRATLF